MASFEVVSAIQRIETIAAGTSVVEAGRLVHRYGHGRWRKLKGVAWIRLRNGHERLAELHWFEAHGIGRVEIKRKRYLD